MEDKASKAFLVQILEELIPFNKFLGFKALEIKKGYAKILVPYREDLLGDPRSKRWHGGVIATALDTVGGAAAITTLTSVEDKISTIDIRVDYLQGTGPKDIVVEGEIVRSGNRIVATKMRAWHSNEEHELIAEGRAVFNVRRKNE